MAAVSRVDLGCWMRLKRRAAPFEGDLIHPSLRYCGLQFDSRGQLPLNLDHRVESGIEEHPLSELFDPDLDAHMRFCAAPMQRTGKTHNPGIEPRAQQRP